MHIHMHVPVYCFVANIHISVFCYVVSVYTYMYIHTCMHIYMYNYTYIGYRKEDLSLLNFTYENGLKITEKIFAHMNNTKFYGISVSFLTLHDIMECRVNLYVGMDKFLNGGLYVVGHTKHRAQSSHLKLFRQMSLTCVLQNYPQIHLICTSFNEVILPQKKMSILWVFFINCNSLKYKPAKVFLKITTISHF